MHELKNLYLYKQGWYSANTEQPIVAANFLSSLDGRIAISPDANASAELPKSLTSLEDFRLFLELHAQADCLITHGGYMRSLAEQKLGNILQLPNTRDCEDLYNWRALQGLSPHPALVIASASLDFPIHPSLKEHSQQVYIATGQQTDSDKIKKWQDDGYEVLITGKSETVEGKPLIETLANKNYKHIYLIAGPKMLHTMINDQQLNKLYLSYSHQILGGNFFRTKIDGPALNTPKLELNALFYDESSENMHGQFFSSYTCNYNKN
ncbi:MAG: riboflavin biosynthesis protein RibD [Gammaproteobacteria bacterium]|nr:MAG: riboflavin biosynthesis protein RibD [Gammaproteobacteria bacterium]